MVRRTFLLFATAIKFCFKADDTPCSGFCGVMSVFSSLRYCTQDDPFNYTNLYFALGFIPLGLFFDFMDGKVARWRERASLMGQELDSLADLVCFAGSARAASTEHIVVRMVTNIVRNRYPLAYPLPPPHFASASAHP